MNHRHTGASPAMPRSALYLLLAIAAFTLSACGGGGGGDGGEAGADPSLFGLKIAGDGEQQIRAIATDSGGNIVVAGYFNGEIDFGEGPVSSQADNDCFIAWYDREGNFIRSRVIGGAGTEFINGVAVDADDNVYVTGFFSSATINFGDSAASELNLIGTSDMFVARYGANGAHRWSFNAGGAGANLSPRAVASSPLNASIAVTGYFSGSVNLGGVNLVSPGGTQVFVARYTRGNGVHLASAAYGDAASQAANDIAIDGLGNLVLTGEFDGSIDFGGGPLGASGGMFADVFLARLDSSLNHLASAGFGGVGGNDIGDAVAIDSNDNIILSGSFVGSIDFGGGVIDASAPAERNFFIARLDSGLVHLFSRGYGGSGIQTGSDVAIGDNDEIVFGGNFNGEVDFGGGPVSANADNVAAARLTRNGRHLDSAALGGDADLELAGVAIGGPGRYLFAGDYSGDLDYGDGTLSNADSSFDSFLLSIALD